LGGKKSARPEKTLAIPVGLRKAPPPRLTLVWGRRMVNPALDVTKDQDQIVDGYIVAPGRCVVYTEACIKVTRTMSHCNQRRHLPNENVMSAERNVNALFRTVEESFNRRPGSRRE